jgi:hypothetical protein
MFGKRLVRISWRRVMLGYAGLATVLFATTGGVAVAHEVKDVWLTPTIVITKTLTPTVYVPKTRTPVVVKTLTPVVASTHVLTPQTPHTLTPIVADPTASPTRTP